MFEMIKQALFPVKYSSVGKIGEEYKPVNYWAKAIKREYLKKGDKGYVSSDEVKNLVSEKKHGKDIKSIPRVHEFDNRVIESGEEIEKLLDSPVISELSQNEFDYYMERRKDLKDIVKTPEELKKYMEDTFPQYKGMTRRELFDEYGSLMMKPSGLDSLIGYNKIRDIMAGVSKEKGQTDVSSKESDSLLMFTLLNSSLNFIPGLIKPKEIEKKKKEEVKERGEKVEEKKEDKDKKDEKDKVRTNFMSIEERGIKYPEFYLFWDSSVSRAAVYGKIESYRNTQQGKTVSIDDLISEASKNDQGESMYGSFSDRNVLRALGNDKFDPLMEESEKERLIESVRSMFPGATGKEAMNRLIVALQFKIKDTGEKKKSTDDLFILTNSYYLEKAAKAASDYFSARIGSDVSDKSDSEKISDLIRESTDDYVANGLPKYEQDIERFEKRRVLVPIIDISAIPVIIGKLISGEIRGVDIVTNIEKTVEHEGTFESGDKIGTTSIGVLTLGGSIAEYFGKKYYSLNKDQAEEEYIVDKFTVSFDDWNRMKKMWKDKFHLVNRKEYTDKALLRISEMKKEFKEFDKTDDQLVKYLIDEFFKSPLSEYMDRGRAEDIIKSLVFEEGSSMYAGETREAIKAFTVIRFLAEFLWSDSPESLNILKAPKELDDVDEKEIKKEVEKKRKVDIVEVIDNPSGGGKIGFDATSGKWYKINDDFSTDEMSPQPDIKPTGKQASLKLLADALKDMKDFDVEYGGDSKSEQWGRNNPKNIEVPEDVKYQTDLSYKKEDRYSIKMEDLAKYLRSVYNIDKDKYNSLINKLVESGNLDNEASEFMKIFSDSGFKFMDTTRQVNYNLGEQHGHEYYRYKINTQVFPILKEMPEFIDIMDKTRETNKTVPALYELREEDLR